MKNFATSSPGRFSLGTRLKNFADRVAQFFISRSKAKSYNCFILFSPPAYVLWGAWMRDERTPKDICGEAIFYRDHWKYFQLSQQTTRSCLDLYKVRFFKAAFALFLVSQKKKVKGEVLVTVSPRYSITTERWWKPNLPVLITIGSLMNETVASNLACSAGVFWAGESCFLCSYCCNRHPVMLWRRKIREANNICPTEFYFMRGFVFLNRESNA